MARDQEVLGLVPGPSGINGTMSPSLFAGRGGIKKNLMVKKDLG